MGADIAHEVDAAALPGGVEYLGDSALDADMGVRDDQLDATQASAGELAQELRPDWLSLGSADL